MNNRRLEGIHYSWKNKNIKMRILKKNIKYSMLDECPHQPMGADKGNKRRIKLKINNSDYGGFIVSNNICNGSPIKYSYREKSIIQSLNGWTFYSDLDTDDYVDDPGNFTILDAASMVELAPIVLEIFDAPFGTELCWLYEEGVRIGFSNMKTNEKVTIEEIVNGD